MTAQFPERLLYEGKEHSMCEEPLSVYFQLSGIYPDLADVSTALWRKYVGSWEIRNDRLYLVGFEATNADGSQADLETLFPGFPERVFAHWYSGTLRLPEGKLLNYVHMGYSSTYERDRLISIRLGKVDSVKVRINGASDHAKGAEGYSVAAFLVYPKPRRGKE